MLEVCRYIPKQSKPETEQSGFGVTDLWLLSVVLVWGFNAVASKFTLELLSPLAVLGVRMAGVGLLLAFVVVVIRRRSLFVERKTLWLFLLGGVLMALQNGTFFWAFKLTTASEAALLISTSPLWVAILVNLCGFEAFCRRNWFGLLMALCGVSMVILGGGSGGEYAPARVQGDLIMVFSAIIFGVYMVIMRGVIQEYGAVRVLAASYLIGAVLLAPFTVTPLIDAPWAEMDVLRSLALSYIVVMAGGYAFMVWYRTIRQTSASRTAIYAYLVPVIAAIAAWILLDEHLAVVQVIGLAVTIAGVYLAKPDPDSICRVG
ncbi:MAG: DMT family transporter [Armatimonadota bacterium]